MIVYEDMYNEKAYLTHIGNAQNALGGKDSGGKDNIDSSGKNSIGSRGKDSKGIYKNIYDNYIYPVHGDIEGIYGGMPNVTEGAYGSIYNGGADILSIYNDKKYALISYADAGNIDRGGDILHMDNKHFVCEKNIQNYCGYEDNMLITHIDENILPKSSAAPLFVNDTDPLVSSPPYDKNIYAEIENIGGSTDFYYDIADNANNFGDKSVSLEEKSQLIHNINNRSENSESYKYIKEAADNTSCSSYSDPTININMGGITQNITENNGESVMDMLVESLLRGLSGKGAGVY